MGVHRRFWRAPASWARPRQSGWPWEDAIEIWMPPANLQRVARGRRRFGWLPTNWVAAGDLGGLRRVGMLRARAEGCWVHWGHD
ncbi:hypothetical protein EJB05_34358 [Eragrostis curvula]|uniref:Uncharacterized protein n=1 Tax=Eragrostis curvula TaxID=38414 RepID=A0A5J9U3M5_9POAL|nr:hypothetical protein EJB05_34358 [Eragrostis curvula]